MNYKSARCFAGHARHCRTNGYRKEARRANHLVALMIDNAVRPHRATDSRLSRMSRLLRSLHGLSR